MNKQTVLLVLAAAGVLGLTASCSSSTSESENKGGSSAAGKGGTSATTAGTSSNGGSSSGGNTSNNGGTTNENGGSTNNTAGFNFGGFSFGGAAPDPDDYMCMPAVETGDACTAGAQPCLSGTEVCLCQAAKWSCDDVLGGDGGAGPGGQLDCPATKPANGGDCGNSFGFCQYGQGGCACFNGNWMCG